MRKPQFSHKAQVLLTAEQFAVLQSVAKQRKQKLGSVLREAFDMCYVAQYHAQKTQAACARLLTLKAPTTDWAAFEKKYCAAKSRRRSPGKS